MKEPGRFLLCSIKHLLEFQKLNAGGVCVSLIVMSQIHYFHVVQTKI